MCTAHKKRYSVLISIVIAVLVGVLGFGLISPKSAAHAEDSDEKHDHGTQFTGGNLTAGTYYLNGDIEGNVTVSGSVKLCLNGHKITIDAHHMTEIEAKDATCTEIGWEAYEGCSRCGYFESRVEKSELGHSYGEWTAVKKATETEEGMENRVCGNESSHVETRAIPKLDHSNIFKSFWIWIIAAGAAALIVLGVAVFFICRKLRKKRTK